MRRTIKLEAASIFFSAFRRCLADKFLRSTLKSSSWRASTAVEKVTTLVFWGSARTSKSRISYSCLRLPQSYRSRRCSENLSFASTYGDNLPTRCTSSAFLNVHAPFVSMSRGLKETTSTSRTHFCVAKLYERINCNSSRRPS